MEITNEIKGKVFAQYLGEQINLKGVSDSGRKFFKCTPSSIDNILNDFLDYKDCTLTLKPLSSISDEDAIEVAKIFGISGDLRVSRSSSGDKSKTFIEGFHSVQVIHEEPNWWSITIPKRWDNKCELGLNVYQYLVSKGYDMPHHLLGGKTLQESGLAIY